MSAERAADDAARGVAVRGAVSGLIAGALAWSALCVASAAGLIELGIIEALLALAPLVVVPLALEARRRLGEDERAPALVRWIEGIARLIALPAALFAAASFALPDGRQAALVAAPWILACTVIGLGGAARALTTWPRSAGAKAGSGGISRERFGIWALLGASSLYLPVGSIWLTLSRLGTPIGGYLVPIPMLTGVHFHYTMFALPTAAAMTGRFLERMGCPQAPSGAPTGINTPVRGAAASGAVFAAIAIVLVLAPAVLLAGWMFSLPPLKIVATLTLAAATTGLAAVILLMSPRMAPPSARTLLRISSGSIVVAMPLAGLYVLGEVFEPLAISIPRMAQVHGVLNALGFTLCGLIGWLIADAHAPRCP